MAILRIPGDHHEDKIAKMKHHGKQWKAQTPRTAVLWIYVEVCRETASRNITVNSFCGIVFEVARPWVVHSVSPRGKAAKWNSRQEHAECMIRPGDELWQMTAAGKTELVQGRTAETVLQNLLSKAHASISTAGSATNMQLGLLFRGLRAMKQLRVDEEIATLRDTGCDVRARAATAENIRSMIACGECRILHFALHCSAEQNLTMFTGVACLYSK